MFQGLSVSRNERWRQILRTSARTPSIAAVPAIYSHRLKCCLRAIDFLPIVEAKIGPGVGLSHPAEKEEQISQCRHARSSLCLYGHV
jgi:hypothetical protein